MGNADLSKVAVYTLILLCSEDIIAALTVGRFVKTQTPVGELFVLEATGSRPPLAR